MATSLKTTGNAVNEFNQYVKPVSLWTDAWRRLRRNKMAVLGMWIVIIYLFVTFFASILPFYSYTDQELMHANLPPSLRPAGFVALDKLRKEEANLTKAIVENKRIELKKDQVRVQGEIQQLSITLETNPVHKRVYILGSDYLGRDMLARTIYGGQISIMIGMVGTLTAGIIGVVIGAIAGFLGGWVDNIIGRFIDLLYSLPFMIIVIVIMSMLPGGSNAIFVMYIAIAMISWLTLSRVVRGQIISLKNFEFVEAARSMGAGSGRIIFHASLSLATLGTRPRDDHFPLRDEFPRRRSARCP